MSFTADLRSHTWKEHMIIAVQRIAIFCIPKIAVNSPDPENGEHVNTSLRPRSPTLSSLTHKRPLGHEQQRANPEKQLSQEILLFKGGPST